MKEVFLVFVGGGLGSLLRYQLGRFINQTYLSAFPTATLIINLLACLLLGLVLGYLNKPEYQNQAARILLAVGFCGGFSTFSTFSYETLTLIRQGQTILALGNVFISVILGLAATFIGLVLVKPT